MVRYDPTWLSEGGSSTDARQTAMWYSHQFQLPTRPGHFPRSHPQRPEPSLTRKQWLGWLGAALPLVSMTGIAGVARHTFGLWMLFVGCALLTQPTHRVSLMRCPEPDSRACGRLATAAVGLSTERQSTHIVSMSAAHRGPFSEYASGRFGSSNALGRDACWVGTIA